MSNGLEKIFEGTPFLMEPDHGSKVLGAAVELENHVKLLRSQGRLDPETLERLRREWGFQQVHESAAIEGNELSLNETRMAILQSITITGKPPKHSLEVQNLHNALQYLENLAKSDGALTEREIREVHSLVLGQGERDAGRYRTIEVAITNSPHKPPLGVAVPGEMQKLAGWLQSRPPIPVPLVASVTHAWLVHIHPFADGNGRTARAVTNLLLMRAGFPVVIIRRKDRQRYYETLRAADDGDIGPLLELVVHRSQDSLHQIDRIRLAAAGISNAILQVQAAERQRFQIWQDAIRLLLSNLQEAFLQCQKAPGFEVQFKAYDLPGEDDYVAIQRRDPGANCWLAKVSIRHGSTLHSLLLWLGYASNELVANASNGQAIPAVKVSAPNPGEYPQWISPDISFPTSIREMAYHQGVFYCLRNDGARMTVSKEQSDFVLANAFASEVIRGWFA